MTPSDPLTLIGRIRILPVVVLDDAGSTGRLAQALREADLPLVEVAFRTPAAEIVLSRLAGEGDLTVGAGTILTKDQVDRAVDAGAKFVVSPGLADDVVQHAHARGVLAVPGVATATEIQRACALGLSTVKLFPAGSLGGPPAVAALAAPFPGVRFIPTGGIGAADVPAYLSQPAVLAVGGSWMVSAALLASGRWDEVTRLTRAAREQGSRSEAIR